MKKKAPFNSQESANDLEQQNGSDQERSDLPSNNEEIARRPYAIDEQRGRFPGSELDDWLEAERELAEGRRDQAA
jgi:hypothetical protein